VLLVCHLFHLGPLATCGYDTSRLAVASQETRLVARAEEFIGQDELN